MWDADFLYFAVAACDDSVDVGRVVPHERVWHGSAGARKNRMFYYDHLKLFVRAQSAALGHRVWIAPKSGDERLTPGGTSSVNRATRRYRCV